LKHFSTSAFEAVHFFREQFHWHMFGFRP